MRFVVESDQSGATVVAEADSEATAVELVDREHADVVVVDVQMPVVEGLAAIGALRRRFAPLKIVVCSFALDGLTAERAMAEGADTCLTKPVRRKDLHGALTTLGSPGGGGGDAPPVLHSVSSLPVPAGVPAVC